jgi:diguanylate cyclase (GGDEF)-like protein
VFARLSGDEFVVLFSDTSKETAETWVADFHQSLQAYNTAVNRGYNIEFSHGIVEFNVDKHLTIESLLADSDARMYERKRTKR